MINVEWKGQMAFEATAKSGCKFTMDAYPEAGGQNLGPTPLEALLSSLAGCTAMDIISILEKKRQVVNSYRLEVEGDRVPEGTWPRPYTAIRIKHILTGENLDPKAIESAIQLSDEKYCSVLATLRQNPTVTSSWTIE